MRKARSSKEKPADLETASESESIPRRKGARRRRDPDATDGESNGAETEDAPAAPADPVAVATEEAPTAEEVPEAEAPSDG